MNYYEELGLTAAASPDEIRKAHRTFSRLLHPDQQTDESLRQAAELQMRRLNSVVDLLLDPQQRRKYDDGLRAPSRVVLPKPPARPPKRPRLSFLQLIAIVAAAVTITLGAIWFFAGDFIPLRAQSSEITVAVRTLPASTRANFVSQTKKDDPPSPSSLLEPLPRHERPEQDRPQAALKQPVESANAMGTDPLPLTPLADAPEPAFTCTRSEHDGFRRNTAGISSSFVCGTLVAAYSRENTGFHWPCSAIHPDPAAPRPERHDLRSILCAISGSGSSHIPGSGIHFSGTRERRFGRLRLGRSRRQ